MSETNPTSIKNLVELLQFRSAQKKGKKLYTFLVDGEEEEAHLSYSEFENQVKKIAAYLQQAKAKGERALLLYPPGLDYIVAFFACLYSGVIAVPAYPPDPSRLMRTLPRLLAIIKDSEAKWVLTLSSIQEMAPFLFQEAPELEKLNWLSTDQPQNETSKNWQEYQPDSKDIAFLQYTSGSTGSPKGVMLTHRNLLHNMQMIHYAFGLEGHGEYAAGASWLPPYHDMGLIGGIIAPLYAGGYTVLISPLHFLQRPLRWLKMVSKYKVTTSGGPNFAYDLCVRKVNEEDKKTLDLSNWTLAFSGAEPIHHETVKRFTEAFWDCGFREEAFYPCYGLAEATLIVSGSKRFAPLVYERFSSKALGEHQIKKSSEFASTLVSCGRNLPTQEIKIVNPENFVECPPDQVGEVWVRGESVAQGYWNKPKESQDSFQAHTSKGEGPFLRTGDFGFLENGNLYVTGRLKDLVIIRGINHYPQDIEHTLEKEIEGLRLGCGAVFSIEQDGEEKLIVMWELDSSSSAQQETLAQKIREKVAEKHEVNAYAVVFIKKGSIPKTSSGKIQRHACKEGYLEESLECLGQWTHRSAATQTNQETDRFTSAKIEHWILTQIAERLEVPLEELDRHKPFAHYGLDSKDLVTFSGDLESYFGLRLSPTLLWKYPNVSALSQYLADMKK